MFIAFFNCCFRAKFCLFLRITCAGLFAITSLVFVYYVSNNVILWYLTCLFAVDISSLILVLKGYFYTPIKAILMSRKRSLLMWDVQHISSAFYCLENLSLKESFSFLCFMKEWQGQGLHERGEQEIRAPFVRNKRNSYTPSALALPLKCAAEAIFFVENPHNLKLQLLAQQVQCKASTKQKVKWRHNLMHEIRINRTFSSFAADKLSLLWRHKD